MADNNNGWAISKGLPPGMTIGDLGELSDSVKSIVDQKLTPRTKYDQMTEDTRNSPWYEQGYKGLATGVGRGFDTIGQIGTEAQEYMGWLPEGSGDEYKSGLRKREAQRDAIEKGLPWGAKGAAMAGEMATDPTSYVPGARQAGWLKRAWDNSWRGAGGSFFGEPATGQGDTATEKIVGAGIGSIASPILGEGISQAGKRGATFIYDKGGNALQKFSEDILNKARANLGGDKRFFDQNGRPTVDFQIELTESGRPWADMDAQQRNSLRETSDFLTSDPMPKTSSQVGRMKDFEDTGISPSVPNIIRTQKNWGEWDRISKDEIGGPDVREHMHNNQLEIEAFDKRLQGRLGGTTKTEYQTGDSVFGSIWDFYKSKDEEISKVYKRIREENGSYTVRPTKLMEGLDFWFSEGDQLTGGVGSNMKNQLRKWGVIGKEGELLDNAPQLTVTQAENLRKILNKKWKSADSTQREAIRDLKSRIDDDVIDGTGSDIYKEGRDLHREFMQSIDGESGRTSLIRKILDGKVKMEDTGKQVLNGGIDDLRSLKSFMMQTEGGVQAFDNLRTSIWKAAFQKGKNNLSNTTEGNVKLGSDGVEIFSGPATAKFIREHLPRELRDELFSEAENATIDAFVRVTSKHMMPPRGSVNTSNTATTLGEMFQGAGGIQGMTSPMFWMRKFIKATQSETTASKARKEGSKMTNPREHLDEMLKRERTISRKQKIADLLQRSPMAPTIGRESSRATQIPEMAGVGAKYGKDAYEKAKQLMRDAKIIDSLRSKK